MDVSDEELKTFVEVSIEVLPMQKKMRQDQRKAIEESSLSMRRYQEIMKAMKSRRGGKPDMTQKEQKEVKEIRKKGKEGMDTLRAKTREVVENTEGITWERFNKIAGALNKDQQLKQRFDKLHKKMRKEAGKSIEGGGRGAP